MKALAILFVLLLLAYVLLGSKRTASGTSSRGSPNAKRNDTESFLKSQWALAEQQKQAGNVSAFPYWFFDPVTERQIKRLEGSEFSIRPCTKGQASDVIGLTEPLEDDDADVLKFFKVPLRNLNQTLGRYRVKALLSDPEKKAAWENRVADAMQKEFMRFVGIQVPKGLTYDAAVAAQNAYMSEHAKDDAAQTKLDEWNDFESIVEELWDADSREIYEIKKPSLPAIRAAVDGLIAEGKKLSELSDEIDLVTDKLLSMKPELARRA